MSYKYFRSAPRILILFIFMSLLSCKESEPIVSLAYKIDAQLGEGAIWNHKTQEFYWIDIVGQKLHILDPETKTQKSWDLPSSVGTVVPYTEKEAVVALVDGIYKINLNDGTLSLLSDVEATLTQNRFNDGKCDPLGNFWVGSMHWDQSEPEASVYKINPQGVAAKMIDSVTISNGIVWSLDNTKMYYIDTPTSKIQVFDYDMTNATISNERTAVVVNDSLGFPDGMTIDNQGKLWVGLWNGNALGRFDPDTGALMSTVPVPAHNVTACAFGGPNFETLYITTASLDMTEEEQAKYKDAGSVFKIKIPGIRGVKANFFGQNNLD